MTAPDPYQTPQPTSEWNPAPPETIPKPSVFPVTLALGASLLVWGLISSFLLSIAGGLLFVVGLAGWIGEIRNERKPH